MTSAAYLSDHAVYRLSKKTQVVVIATSHRYPSSVQHINVVLFYGQPVSSAQQVCVDSPCLTL